MNIAHGGIVLPPPASSSSSSVVSFGLTEPTALSATNGDFSALALSVPLPADTLSFCLDAIVTLDRTSGSPTAAELQIAVGTLISVGNADSFDYSASVTLTNYPNWYPKMLTVKAIGRRPSVSAGWVIFVTTFLTIGSTHAFDTEQATFGTILYPTADTTLFAVGFRATGGDNPKPVTAGSAYHMSSSG
jgi:hypothetical protein